MFGWFKKKTAPSEECTAMPSSARRHAMRANILATNQGGVAKTLGVASRNTPPSARRVAARAMVLAGLAVRAHFEIQRHEIPNPESVVMNLCREMEDLGIADELEPYEHDFLRTPLGHADQAAIRAATWRPEGLAVLAWALSRLELPAYDEGINAAAAVNSVCFGSPLEIARQFLDSAALRPTSEIELYATHATLVTWRLRQFGMAPTPLDYAAYLRGHASFRETWLEGLRFVDGDLAIGDQAVTDAAPELVDACHSAAFERHIAVYWLQGDDPIYSMVDPSTLWSAC